MVCSTFKILANTQLYKYTNDNVRDLDRFIKYVVANAAPDTGYTRLMDSTLLSQSALPV